MISYDKNIGIIYDNENRRKPKVELSVGEMKIMEILEDGKWHKATEIEEALDVSMQNRILRISRLRKKIKRYRQIEVKRGKGEYRCVKIKKKRERQ